MILHLTISLFLLIASVLYYLSYRKSKERKTLVFSVLFLAFSWLQAFSFLDQHFNDPALHRTFFYVEIGLSLGTVLWIGFIMPRWRSYILAGFLGCATVIALMFLYARGGVAW